MIDRVVADIPNAEHGFTLIFAASPFPGGNWYRSADLDMEGWLCPALFRYFDQATLCAGKGARRLILVRNHGGRTSGSFLRLRRRLARRPHALTSAAAAPQPLDESCNRGARSYRSAR